MIGEQLGLWILDRELGRGGMGRVYLAHHQQHPEILAAIKVVTPELASESSFPTRFQREIDILRSLDHPQIVRYLDSGEQDGRLYLVMEFIPGPSLQTLLETKGRLTWEEVLKIALEIAPALKHAHDRGIIHRDLKPSNLLLMEPYERNQPLPEVKLTDFGIACLYASPHLTQTGQIIGTPEFLSPEQAKGKPLTRRSDIYSLGAVLYFLLTGKTPFEGDGPAQLHKHVYGRFELPRRLVPEIPPDFDLLVCQMMDKDPACRPADGAVLARRLVSLAAKMERNQLIKGQEIHPSEQATKPAMPRLSNQEGPATMAGRVVRDELDSQNRGGPIQQIFNNPWVLLPLFLLCVGGIVYTFWPASDETLLLRGSSLVDSDSPVDWDRAWTEYLEPLQKRKTNQIITEKLKHLQKTIEEKQQGQEAHLLVKKVNPMTEAQWFYNLGLRYSQQGRDEEALKIWNNLFKAFQQVPSEKAWVALAAKQIQDATEATPKRDTAPVVEAWNKAEELEKNGEKMTGAAIREAILQLYQDEPKIVESIKKQK